MAGGRGGEEEETSAGKPAARSWPEKEESTRSKLKKPGGEGG